MARIPNSHYLPMLRQFEVFDRLKKIEKMPLSQKCLRIRDQQVRFDIKYLIKN